MGSCFKSYLSYKFDRPEKKIRDRSKMIWPVIVSRDSPEIISSPGWSHVEV